MSADMYAWEPSIGLDPGASNFQHRVEAYSGAERSAPPSAAIRAFVMTLISRYPDLSAGDDVDTVWADGPLIGDASGGFINVSIVWNRYDVAAPFFIETANASGLSAYDPQTDKFYPAKPNAKVSRRSAVHPWIWGAVAVLGLAAMPGRVVSRRDLLAAHF